jgi:hypothetical protein
MPNIDDNILYDTIRALRSHGEEDRALKLASFILAPAESPAPVEPAAPPAQESEDIESLKARVVKAREALYDDRLQALEVREKNDYDLIEAHDDMIKGLCRHLGLAYPPTRAQPRSAEDRIVPRADDAPKSEQVYPLFWLKREKSGDIWLIITPQGGRQAMLNLGQSHGFIVAGAIEDAMKVQGFNGRDYDTVEKVEDRYAAAFRADAYLTAAVLASHKPVAEFMDLPKAERLHWRSVAKQGIWHGVPEPPVAPTGTPGVYHILEERDRQIKVEGWTVAHDLDHSDGTLEKAAACYALRGLVSDVTHDAWWPFDSDWFKPSNKLRNLSKAGALIAAAIDREMAKQAKGLG